METHFEGSRGDNSHKIPHQRTQNEPRAGASDDHTSDDASSRADSNSRKDSRTEEVSKNAESAKTQTNQVQDKPILNRNESV